MMDVERLSRHIENFSRIDGREDSTGELKDELVSLASELRSSDIPYHFEYRRPDTATFRLRSSSPPGEDAFEERIQFLEPGRQLRVVLDDVSEEVFRGVCSELTILGERDETGGHSVREPELNLLTSRYFQAELYAEFQRWQRYDSPLYVVTVGLGEDVDWRPAAKELKHAGKRRDILGLLGENLVAGIFSSRPVDQSFAGDISERIEVRYDSGDVELNIVHVPEDVTNWNQLQDLISESDLFEERDFVES